MGHSRKTVNGNMARVLFLFILTRLWPVSSALECGESKGLTFEFILLGEHNGKCYGYQHQFYNIYQYLEDEACPHGRQAQVSSGELQDFVFKKLEAEGHLLSFITMWIGLMDLTGTGDWRWENGDPVTWTNWASDPGEGHHAFVDGDNPYWQLDDANVGGVLCEIDPMTTQPTPGTITVTSEAILSTNSPEESVRTTPRRTQRRRTRVRNSVVKSTAFSKIGQRDAYITKTESRVLQPCSAIKCSLMCLEIPDCVVTNHNPNTLKCRIFNGPDALEYVQHSIGWDVWVSEGKGQF